MEPKSYSYKDVLMRWIDWSIANGDGNLSAMGIASKTQEVPPVEESPVKPTNHKEEQAELWRRHVEQGKTGDLPRPERPFCRLEDLPERKPLPPPLPERSPLTESQRQEAESHMDKTYYGDRQPERLPLPEFYGDERMDAIVHGDGDFTGYPEGLGVLRTAIVLIVCGAAFCFMGSRQDAIDAAKNTKRHGPECTCAWSEHPNSVPQETWMMDFYYDGLWCKDSIKLDVYDEDEPNWRRIRDMWLTEGGGKRQLSPQHPEMGSRPDRVLIDGVWIIGSPVTMRLVKAESVMNENTAKILAKHKENKIRWLAMRSACPVHRGTLPESGR